MARSIFALVAFAVFAVSSDVLDAPRADATELSAPAPRLALSLFVGFENGACIPRGDDHTASLYAASSLLNGKSGCGTGAWKLSAPGLSLASSQLAGNLALLGSDLASGQAWGTWVMGSVGGGPPYTQLLSQMSFGLAGGPPTVGFTCRTPMTAIGVPAFDTRVDASSPLFFTNGSFAVFSDPAISGGVSTRNVDSSAQLLELLESTSAGAFIKQNRNDSKAPFAVPHALRADDIPFCSVRTLGSFALPASGTQQAVIFDKTTQKPCAVTVTLTAAAGGIGRIVTVQRLSVATGAPVGAPTILSCVMCDAYLYQPVTLANNVLILSTINYTTSVITSFAGRLGGGNSLTLVAGSQNFILRESDVVSLPSAGASAPYPAGFVALQTTTSTDSWACHNKSTERAVRVGSIARAGARLNLVRTCSLPLCPLETDAGGCIIPQFGFA